MRSFSNTYIFVFSTVMVIIVAAILSFAAMQLKPFQERNIEIEKKKNILASINIPSTQTDAEIKYNTYITESITIDYEGNIVKEPPVEAFYINIKKELDKDPDKRTLPLFIGKMEDGSVKYIIPVMGKGLWGPIWGYIALNDDYNTVFGVTFSHSKETPGLGAEIVTETFQKQFQGKKIFSNTGKFLSVKVVKGGADKTKDNEVDAISGGTITSNGLQEMLYECITYYIPYIEKQSKTK